ncbi:hypothetical protein B7R21_18090 [Subtercola boreus]|uniref:AbiEi antitoxin N-terminal domain-containing protein n=2 Tax=Subtercola boreus TaxID=120213 RepID=A0A3E0VBI9_9MICO|nr:hypothetical protein B7R21_18090 [Subtercola boreus]
MTATEALRTLQGLSSAQWGMLTTGQAAARGVTRLQLGRLAAAGHLERLTHGVYRDAGSPPTEYDDVRAVWLSLDPTRTAEQRIGDGADGAVVGGPTATYLHQIGDLQPEPYVFLSQIRRQSHRSEVQYRQRTLSPDDITIVHGLPVSTPERAVADLVQDKEDTSLVADVLADAVRKTPIRLDRLAEILGPFAARNGHDKNDGAGFLEDLLERGGVDATTQATRIVRSTAWQSTAWPELNTIVQQAVAAQLPNFSNLAQFEELLAQVRLNMTKLTFAVPDFSEAIRKTLGSIDYAGVASLSAQLPDYSKLMKAVAETANVSRLVASLPAAAVTAGNTQSLQHVQQLAQHAATLSIVEKVTARPPAHHHEDRRGAGQDE